MILIPLEPNAGPIGGAGLAWPPLHWSFTKPVISFAIFFDLLVQASRNLRDSQIHLSSRKPGYPVLSFQPDSRERPNWGRKIRVLPPINMLSSGIFLLSKLQFRYSG